MSDLGDLGNFLKDGGVANLDWLDVSEKDYRESDRLPKQNLNVAPDLQALWSHEDKPSTFYLEPNKDRPHTMVDLGPEGPVRAKPEDVRKVARFAMMASSDMTQLREQLLRRFTVEDLRAHRAVLASVIEERGLLGGYYVAAADFPGCHNGSKSATEFVRRHSADAKFIEAKPECGSCVHAQKIGSTTNCAIFHKQVVPQIPYTDTLAGEVERREAMRGKAVQASAEDPKERVRLALLAKKGLKKEATYSGVGLNQLPAVTTVTSEVVDSQLISASSLLKKKAETDRLALKAKPIVAFLRQEMLKGHTGVDLVKSLKVAFPTADLAETRKAWEPIFGQVGLYGTIYSTQDSFDDCRVGADTLAKHNPGIRAIEASSKCDSCIYNKISRCMLYGKPLVREASELLTWETVDAVIAEHKLAGKLQPWETKTASWGETPREALKTLHTVTKKAVGPKYAPGRLDVFHAFTGGPVTHVAQAKRNIVKTAARYLNEGLYGQDLLSALKKSFEVRDLKAAAADLKPLIAEQGLQGIYYVDPAVYEDYGHGCKEASRLFRAKQVPYVKVQDKCASCVHNRSQHCTQLNKPLVVEPPYLDKKAQQQALLATGPATDHNPANLVNSGLSMLAEFQMQNGGLEVEVAPQPGEKVAIQIGREKIKI